MNSKAIVAGVVGAGAAGALATRALTSRSDDDYAEGELVASPVHSEVGRHLGDLLTLARHNMKTLHRQLSDAELETYPAARAIVSDAEAVLDRHIMEMEVELDQVGGSSGSAVKGAVTAVTSAAAGLYGRVREEPVSRMLRDDYTALTLHSAGCAMLHTTALGLGQDALATRSKAWLGDVTPLVQRLGNELPAVVLQELSREGLPVDTGVGHTAVSNIQEAWSHSMANGQG